MDAGGTFVVSGLQCWGGLGGGGGGVSRREREVWLLRGDTFGQTA